MGDEPPDLMPATPHEPLTPRRWHVFAGPIVLLLIVLGLFSDVLFSDGTMMLSKDHTDAVSQFVPWRQWGFDQIRAGHLPLWNPHAFCGMPFVGMFQSALFY